MKTNSQKNIFKKSVNMIWKPQYFCKFQYFYFSVDFNPFYYNYLTFQDNKSKSKKLDLFI